MPSSRKTGDPVLNAEAAERVIEAVGLPVVIKGPQREQLVRALADHLGGFGRAAAGPRPVSRAEADAIEKAIARLRGLVDALQDRANPPPQLDAGPTSRNRRSTSIDHWLTPHRFPAISGRPKSYDWPWISRLLAFYEILFGRTPRASPAGENQKKPHPTMRFLDAALAEVRGISGKARSRPFPPDTLRAYLKRGGRRRVERDKFEIEQLLDLPGREKRVR